MAGRIDYAGTGNILPIFVLGSSLIDRTIAN